MLRAKDQSGLRQLYLRYADTIYGIICRIVKDKGKSEEVLQQVMLKAWNSFDSYKEDKGSLFTWLNIIARNTSIDTIRLKGFQNAQKSETINTTVYNIESDSIDTSKIDVQMLLDGMEEKYRQVLEKVYLEGYSQSQAAEVLEIPLGTVKTRLRQAILQLREKLKSEKTLFFGIFILIILMLLQWL